MAELSASRTDICCGVRGVSGARQHAMRLSVRTRVSPVPHYGTPRYLRAGAVRGGGACPAGDGRAGCAG